jgi:DNA-binding MarR family transcriptional regulator
MTRTPVTRPAPPDPLGEFPVDPTTYFFHLFSVVSRHRDARIDEMLAPLGLNVSRHRALAGIGRRVTCTMTELAQINAVDRTTMTRTVDQLVQAGLVERRTPAYDRRQVVLSLTAEGIERANKALAAIRVLGHELMAGLPEEMRRVGCRNFVTVLGNLVADRDLLDRLLINSSADPAPDRPAKSAARRGKAASRSA